MAAMTSSPRPKMRPEPMMGGNDAEARNGNGGGKGGEAKSQKQIQSSMTDKRWGYYDPYTAKKVPWFIDMINGGGMNAAGSTFSAKDTPMLGAKVGSGLLNALGVSPYGQERERTYGGGDFWRGGEFDPARMYQFGGAAPAPSGPTRSPSRPSWVNEAGMGLDPFGGSMTPMEQTQLRQSNNFTANLPSGLNMRSQQQQLRQPAGTPTSAYEPRRPLGGTIPATGMTYGGVSSGNLEDQMRQKMRSAGYDPTGLGPMELQTFIQAMGL